MRILVRQVSFFLVFGVAVCAASIGTWTELGPGNIGGKTLALVISPADPNTMYTAGTSGGIWKTTNAGASWAPLDDFMANLAVSCLAMDPTDPDTIYAGTGEAIRGAGIFKTTDGGSTWFQLAGTNNVNFYYVNDVVVSPLEHVYAAAKTGVWRSTDGGTNWSQVLYSLDDTPEGCQDLAVKTDPANDYVFAGCGIGFGGKIFRNTSAQGGGSWTQLSLGVNSTSLARISLAIAPSNQNFIYALAGKNKDTSPFNRGLYAVFRSTDSGNSWTTQYLNDDDATKLSNMILSDPYEALCLGAGNQIVNHGNLANVIAVDPLNSDRVFAAGVDLFRSDDGGVTWGLASEANAANALYLHADQHNIVFHPDYDAANNQILFVTNDGGIYRTDNALALTATDPCVQNNGGLAWTELNNSYAVTQFLHGVLYPDGTTYFGGTEDSGTIRGNDTDGPQAWTQIRGGDGGYVAVDPGNPATLYAEDGVLSIKKSTDGGATFFSATTGIADTGFPPTPLVMDPTDPQRLWAGGTAIWRTDNAAGVWTQASSGLGGKGITCIAVSLSDPNHVLAGRINGSIIRTNQGLTATSTTTWPSLQLRTGIVSSVAFDPSTSNIAYATYSTFNQRPADAHVLKTTDGGASWEGIDGSGANKIPDIRVYSIVVNPGNTSILYAGTDLGIFTSSDGGSNWIKDAGFPNVPTRWLALNSYAGNFTLFAFTYGRGAWRVDLGPAPIPPTVSITDPPDGSIVSGTISVTADANDDTGVNKVEFYAGGSLIGTAFSFPYSIQWDTTTGANGSKALTAKAYDIDGNTGTSLPVTVIVDNPITALFQDDFDDNLVAPWTIGKGVWTESAGDLRTTTSSKSIMRGPAGTACGECQISNDLTIITAGATVWIYGWYADSGNYVRVELNDAKNKITLFQKAAGTTVFKQSVDVVLNANQSYNVAVGYAGGKFQLYLDGAHIIIDRATAKVPSSTGKVTYTLKAATVSGVKVSTTANFHAILITP